MDILKPYIGLNSNLNERSLIFQYEEKFRKLQEERDKAILDYHLNLFKNFKFKKRIVDGYIKNPNDLCCDIVMINNVKQAYENDKNLSVLEIGTEDNETASNKYSYELGYTSEFDSMSRQIDEIAEEIYADNCYSDMCTLGYYMPDGTFKNFIEYEFEYEQDYYGSYVYHIETFLYPIILELEKLINSKSEILKKAIREMISET